MSTQIPYLPWGVLTEQPIYSSNIGVLVCLVLLCFTAWAEHKSVRIICLVPVTKIDVVLELGR